MMKKPKKIQKDNLEEKEWEHLAIKPSTKTLFESFMSYLTTREKPKVTQDELLRDMIGVYEKHKIPSLIANDNKK